MILGVNNVNFIKMNKAYYTQVKEEFHGPIRRQLGGRKDAKGRT